MILWFIYIYIYIILESILESLLNSCTFVEGKFHRRDAYANGEKTYFMRKPCSICFTLCLFSCFSLWCFELLLVSIYSLFLSLHYVYVLDMLSSLYYYAFLLACSDNYLFCYVIIVVISIWLSCVWSSCSYVSYRVYLIAFYLLLYTCPLLLALPWGSNMFCASVSKYRYFIPSLSQVLDLCVSKFFYCS